MNNTAYAFTGWRRVAATALIFTAALSVGTVDAMTADARPKPKTPKTSAYLGCVAAALPTAQGQTYTVKQVNDAEENCCLTLGGIFNTSNPGQSECYFSGEPTVYGDGGAPPIGATAAPHRPPRAESTAQ